MPFYNGLRMVSFVGNGNLVVFVVLLTLVGATSSNQFKNITARYEVPDVLDNLFGFTARVPRKPFTKKSNFLSFETTNQNVEIGFEFSVPFLTVPVKQSVDSVRQTAQSVMTPLANINTGAIFLAGVMVMAGVTTTYLWRMLSNMYQSDKRRFSYPRCAQGKDVDPGQVEQMLDMLERLLQRYDIDAKVCAQRLLCSTVRQAAGNVADGVGSSADKVIDGVTSSTWVQRWSYGSSLEPPLQLARSDAQNCEETYAKCLVSYDKLEVFVRQLLDKF